MEFEVPINTTSRLIYLKKEMVKILGDKAKAVPNRCAILFFNYNMEIDDVLESIDAIKIDLEHAKRLQTKKQGENK